MHLEGKSSTKSSKSNTYKDGLGTPVQFVKGVGPKLAQLLKTHQIETVGDLLTFFPRAYEDRTRITPVRELHEDTPSTFRGRVVSARRSGWGARRFSKSFEAMVADDSGHILLKWFRAHQGLEESLQVGREWIFHGVPKRAFKSAGGRMEVIHPELSTLGQKEQHGRMVPVYREISGLSTRLIRKILWAALESARTSIQDPLPPVLMNRHQFPDLATSFKMVHFPDESGAVQEHGRSRAWDRLVYEEFYRFESVVRVERENRKKEQGFRWDPATLSTELPKLRSLLPFQFTDDQERSMNAMLEDCCSGFPMNRLLQGDVGSGKTVLALLLGALACRRGGQAVLMAPTEILAQQHFQTASRWLSSAIPSIRLLHAGTSASERHSLLDDLRKGAPALTIGTHAVLEPDITFKHLELIIVDEQHRFGIDQRNRLLQKTDGRLPHALWMTATPIPRTLSMTLYGNLEVSSLKQKPAGRQPIRTHVVPPMWQARAIERIREQLDLGRQVYWVFPAIEDSSEEANGSADAGLHPIKSIEKEEPRIRKELFPDRSVDLLHGRMTSEQKQTIMKAFSKGETDILISTTVIEVGMDVANATVMVIENSERFGLSQLHQLRGRVGRGDHASWCFLFCNDRLSEVAQERLKILEKSEDGFEIAETDLKIRGPGEFLGKRQAGAWPFKIADPTRDAEWFEVARIDSMEVPSQPDPIELLRRRGS